MTNKRYAIDVSIILWISVVLMLFIFILVAHHRNVEERVRQDRLARAAAWSAADRIKPAAPVSAPSAGAQREPVKSATAAPAASRDGQQVYQASCVVCHGAGIAGAPKLEDKGQWTTRMAKGVDILYASAVNGVQGSAGVMPAKGGNPALSNDEVRAAVDYMVVVARSK